VKVRVFGDRDAKRNDLQAFALGLINKRLSVLDGVLVFPFGEESEVIHDIAGKAVEATTVAITGPAQWALDAITIGTVSLFPAVDDTFNFLTTPDGQASAAPEDDSLSRSTYLERLVVATLSAPCDTSRAAGPKFSGGIPVGTPGTRSTLAPQSY
jgi:hypothetical protein